MVFYHPAAWAFDVLQKTRDFRLQHFGEGLHLILGSYLNKTTATALATKNPAFAKPWSHVTNMPEVEAYAQTRYIRVTSGPERLTDLFFASKPIAIIQLGTATTTGVYHAYLVQRMLVLTIQQSNELTASGLQNFKDCGLNIQGCNGAQYVSDSSERKQTQAEGIMDIWNSADPANMRELESLVEAEINTDVTCFGVQVFSDYIANKSQNSARVEKKKKVR